MTIPSIYNDCDCCGYGHELSADRDYRGIYSKDFVASWTHPDDGPVSPYVVKWRVGDYYPIQYWTNRLSPTIGNGKILVDSEENLYTPGVSGVRKYDKERNHLWYWNSGNSALGGGPGIIIGSDQTLVAVGRDSSVAIHLFVVESDGTERWKKPITDYYWALSNGMTGTGTGTGYPSESIFYENGFCYSTDLNSIYLIFTEILAGLRNDSWLVEVSATDGSLISNSKIANNVTRHPSGLINNSSDDLYLFSSGVSDNQLLEKYNSSFSQQWTLELDSSSLGRSQHIPSLAIDRSGEENVYVQSRTFSPTGYQLHKIDSVNQSEIWTYGFQGFSQGLAISDITIDRTNNVAFVVNSASTLHSEEAYLNGKDGALIEEQFFANLRLGVDAFPGRMPHFR